MIQMCRQCREPLIQDSSENPFVYVKYDFYISLELFKFMLFLYNPASRCFINFEKFLLALYIYNFKKLFLFKNIFQKPISHFNLFYRTSIKILQLYLIFLKLKFSELIQKIFISYEMQSFIFSFLLFVSELVLVSM